MYRVLGKKGRITIPFEMRKRVGFSSNDILSFTEQDDNTIIVKREKICDNCNDTQKVAKEENIFDFLNGLSAEQKRKILIHLSVEWAEKQGGKVENQNISD